MAVDTSRNLVARLRDEGIAKVSVGEWKEISTPENLVRLDFGDTTQQGLATRIQSIPSPWARMLLFKDALEDEHHPARPLVANELLDAFEFLWSQSTRQGDVPVWTTIHLDHLKEQDRGEIRVVEFLEALVDLTPRTASGREPAFRIISLARVAGRPVLGTSPYTGLFTAEDAAGQGTARFFEFMKTAEARPLRVRAKSFQRYVAQVILKQLEPQPPLESETPEWPTLRRVLGNWIKREVAAAPEAAAAAQQGLALDDAVLQQGLEPIAGISFGGLRLYHRRQGADAKESRWALRPRHPGSGIPLVLEPGQFDGEYYPGAARVQLRPLAGLDRSILPVLGERHAWVCPSEDWFTHDILLLAEPLESTNVYGVRNYEWRGNPSDTTYGVPRFTLPLRADFFRYFAPEDVDRMLSLVVHPSGEVDAVLRVPVGSGSDARDLEVTRRYRPSAQYGLRLSVWPTFRDDRWRDYVVFRNDQQSEAAVQMPLSAFSAEGKPVLMTTGVRTPTVRTHACSGAPEVLELRGAASHNRSFGVVLPRFRAAPAATGIKWAVGFDFGTSNTVVGIRQGESGPVQVLDPGTLTLPLTQAAEGTAELADAYFFPERIQAAPFGTAVVALQEGANRVLAQEPLGLRINVPFSGYVNAEDSAGDHQNRVVGDLKWSADAEHYFLSAAFLRHVVAVVAAAAIQRGVAPQDLRFHWAFPRAFTPTQLAQLRGQWQHVMESMSGLGLSAAALEEPLDESTSVLRYFFDTGAMHVGGATRAILDVGGGTTDLAAYGGGRALLLDSVMLGGRNLTGPFLRARDASERQNPFVRSFVTWAAQNGLRRKDVEAVQAYLAAEEVHLAFSYLVGTDWFARGEAGRFTASPAFERFQLLVLYFYGALFHYLGLTFRGQGLEAVPRAVVVGGNGSRYLSWLWGFHGAAGVRFFDALGGILVRAAGHPDATLPAVEVSSAPKREVAQGLVAPRHVMALDRTGVRESSTVGEAVELTRQGRTDRFEPPDPYGSDDVIRAEEIASLRWISEELEIERFHTSFLAAVGSLAPQGGVWQAAAAAYRDVLAGLPPHVLTDEARGRMEFLAGREGGQYRGSIFILEAAAVLEQILRGIRST